MRKGRHALAWMLFLLISASVHGGGSDEGAGGTFLEKVESLGMVEETGSRVTSKLFLGKTSFVFFGYTHCQRICPMTLSSLHQAFSESDWAGRAQVIFVSVDKRDSAQSAHQYGSSFGQEIRGIGGAKADTEALYQFFVKGVSSRLADPADHSALVYVVNPEGKYVGAVDIRAGRTPLKAQLSQYIR